ncbi:DUF4214 domain-containing protein [Phaeobacter italicus]|uniref:DUF4214 domain-containing protein n=1 Tax=Phaeobacter italicus TaxID=481446 RepID=UPI0035165BF3
MAISAEDKNFLVSLYVGYFNRAPDPAGLQFWIDQVEAGRDTNTIAADFAASPEAKSLYPFLTTPDVSSPTSFITAVYANLFNRTPDAAGQAFWEAQLSSGAVSPADAIDAIIKGAATAPDSTILANKNAVGLDFATDAGNTPGFTFDLNGSSGSAAKSAISGVTEDASTVVAAQAATDAYLNGVAGAGETFTLTTGPDGFTGTSGNDTFVASETTLSSADVLNGGAGTDDLRYASSGATAVTEAGFETSNIENARVTSDATGGTIFDVTGMAGLTGIENSNSSTNVSFTGLGSIAGLTMTNVSGGNTNVQYKDAVLSGTADAQSITLEGNADNTGAAASAISIGNTTSGGTAGVETLNVATTGSASRLTAINTGATTINVSGDQDLTVTGALVDATTIDASTMTGKLSVVADSAGTAKDVAVTGGTGDDTANFSAGFEADDSFDGGEGTDTIVLTQATASGTLGGTLTNTEQLSISNDGTGTIDMDNFAGITKVIYDSGVLANGTATVDDAVTGLEVEVDIENPVATDGSLVVDLKTDGTSDALTITLDDIGAGEGLALLSAEDAETLNISADDDTTDGSGTLTIAALTATDATAINLSGDAMVTIGGTNDPATPVLATLDASAMTDGLTISGTNFAAGGATVTLGAGDDTFNVATMAGADTFTLGGGKDTVVYNAVAQSSGSKVDTITDFVSGTDVVNVTALLGGTPSSTNFVGVFSSFGAAQGAVNVGSNNAVFQSDTNTLWVDANNDGTLNANDLQVVLTGVTSITAVDLGLSAGTTINLTAPAAVVNATTKTNADNSTTNGNDTINASFAELANSSVDGLAGTDTLVIEDAVTGAFTLGNAVTATQADIDNVENVTLAAGSTATLTIADAGILDVTVSTGNSNVALANGATADVDFVGGSGTDVLTLDGVAYDAASSFDGNGAGDVLGVVDATSIRNATVSEFETLNLADAAGTTNVEMTVAQHNAFTSFIGGAGTDEIELFGGGTLTGNALVEDYDASTSGGTATYDFTLGAAGQSFDGDDGADSIRTNGLTATGTLDGDTGTDTLFMTTGGNVAGATLVSIENANITGNVTMTGDQHDAFTGGITGAGNADAITMVMDDGNTTTKGSATVETYNVNSAAGATPGTPKFELGAFGQNVTESGADIVIYFDDAGTYTGSVSSAERLQIDDGVTLAGTYDTSFGSAATLIESGASITMTSATFNEIDDGTITAAGTETVTLTTSGTTVADAAIENYVLNGAGADTFTAGATTSSVSLAGGGSDIVAITNAVVNDGTDSRVTISNFTAGNDDLDLAIGGAGQNAGFQTVTAAASNVTVAPNGIIEINAAVGEVAGGNFAGFAGVEALIEAATGTVADGNYTAILYSGADAGIYNVTVAGGDNFTAAGAGDDVELIGVVTGVGADALGSADFI